jgi:hypothetical protein
MIGGKGIVSGGEIAGSRNPEDEGGADGTRPASVCRSTRWTGGRRRPRAGMQSLVIVIIVVELWAVVGAFGPQSAMALGHETVRFTHVSIPHSADGQSGLSAFTTDYTVTFYCYNGVIILVTKGDTQLCSNSEGGASFPAGSYTLTFAPDPGYTWNGQVSTTGSVSWLSGEMKVSGYGTLTATFNGCTSGPSISSAASQVQYGYRQAWVNWSFSYGELGYGGPGFSWSVGSTTLPYPALSGSGGARSVDLNDLTAGTTYSYTVSAANNCGTAEKSGSFTTASSLLTIDGSNVTYSTTGATSLTTTLTTNLSHDLIIAQVISSDNTGNVTGCTDSQRPHLTWNQRAAYVVSSGSPADFEMYAEASSPLSSDSITCTFSVANYLGGLVVFGVANAYLASPYDPEKACTAQGTTGVSCTVTTTSPDDMLLGFVSSYHASGAPLKPGSGFQQIRQEDAGPYDLAEFAEAGSNTGSYTISATKSDGVGMALIGDAVKVAPFVGWVSQMVSNQSMLDQIGMPMGGVHVWPVASCYFETVAATWYVGINHNFTGATTSSSGYYQVGLPESTTYSIHSKYYNPVVTQTLGWNGACVTTDNYGNKYSQSHSGFALYSNVNGYWNATAYFPATPSARYDYQQFGLPPNNEGVTSAGVGFVHNLNAGCTIGLANGESQSIQSSFNIAGTTFATGNTGYYNHMTTASAANDSESNIALDWNTTGVLNESSGVSSASSVILAAYTYNHNPYSHSTDTVSFVDPDGSIASPGTTNYTVGPGHTAWENYSNGGSFTSSGGLDLAIGLTGGWDALQFGGDLLSVQYETLANVSAGHEIDCSIHNPSTTENLQYYMIVDGSQVGAGEAVNVHLWFDRYCFTGNGCE